MTPVLEVKTVQCPAIRALIEVLKDVLTESNLVFDSQGMTLMQMDGQSSVLVSVRLNASGFESYVCTERILVGVNFGNLHRLLKTMCANDTLTMRVTQERVDVMELILHNADKKVTSRFEMNLLDIDEQHMNVPDTEFGAMLSMPSADLQRTCRDLAGLSEVITIRTANRELVLDVDGDFARQVVTIGERDSGGLVFSSVPDEPATYGQYSLKYLNLFSKATLLCPTVDMYLKSAYPLILNFNVANMGRIVFCLAQKTIAKA